MDFRPVDSRPALGKISGLTCVLGNGLGASEFDLLFDNLVSDLFEL